MGYLGNHLATVVMGVFSAILTGLWPVFVDMAPILNFVFLMAVPIAWFITFMCWIVQKGADYSHKYSASLKKNHNNPARTVIKYTADGRQVTSSQLNLVKTELGSELDQIKNSEELKYAEIENMKKEIANLKTMVEIESLKSELANLKKLASKGKTKRKSKKK